MNWILLRLFMTVKLDVFTLSFILKLIWLNLLHVEFSLTKCWDFSLNKKVTKIHHCNGPAVKSHMQMVENITTWLYDSQNHEGDAH